MTLDEANAICDDISSQNPELIYLIENGTKTESYLAAVVRALLFKIEEIGQSPAWDSWADC